MNLLDEPRLRHRVSFLFHIQRVKTAVHLSHFVELLLLLINFEKFGCYLTKNVLDNDFKRLIVDVFLQLQAVEIMLHRFVDHGNQICDDYFADVSFDLLRKVLADLRVLLDITLILWLKVSLELLVLIRYHLLDGWFARAINLTHDVAIIRPIRPQPDRILAVIPTSHTHRRQR